ncbi:hypothetical protein D3C86_1940180 [compost metagenome]
MLLDRTQCLGNLLPDMSQQLMDRRLHAGVRNIQSIALHLLDFLEILQASHQRL